MIKVGIVGFGWWGRHIAALLVQHPGFSVQAIADPQTDLWPNIQALRCAAVARLDDLLEHNDLDAIILTSPNNLHDAQVAACAANGLHVFCEKPLSLTADGARASIEACRHAGVVLGVGHERRFEPALQSLKAAVASGELGTILHTELAFSHNKLKHLDRSSWRTSKEFAPAASLTQTGIHLTDLLIWLYGAVEQVHAVTANSGLDWETGDLLAVQLRFKAGMTAHLQAILNTPHFLRTHVFGTDEHVEIRNASHPADPGGKVTMTRYRAPETHTDHYFQWSDAVVANLESFAAAIDGTSTYAFSDFEKLHNIEVLEAIVSSATTGQAVHL